MNPSLAEAQSLLGSLYLIQGKSEEAVEMREMFTHAWSLADVVLATSKF